MYQTSETQLKLPFSSSFFFLQNAILAERDGQTEEELRRKHMLRSLLSRKVNL